MKGRRAGVRGDEEERTGEACHDDELVEREVAFAWPVSAWDFAGFGGGERT